MRKIWLLWGIVVVILLLGAGLIIYSNVALKKEAKKVETTISPVTPPKLEKKEKPAKIEPPEAIPPLDVESLKTPENEELPVVPEAGVTLPPMPPRAYEPPVLPKIPATAPLPPSLPQIPPR